MRPRAWNLSIAGLSLAALIGVYSVSARERANEALFNALADVSATAIAHQGEALQRAEAELNARIASLNQTVDAKVEFLLARAYEVKQELLARQEQAGAELPAFRSALARLENELVSLTAALHRGENVHDRVLAFIEERTAPPVPWAVPIEWQSRERTRVTSLITGEVLHEAYGDAVWHPQGTGFFLRPGIIVTAGHVLAPNGSSETGEGQMIAKDGTVTPVKYEMMTEDLGRSFLLGTKRVLMTDIRGTELPEDVGYARFDPAAYAGPYPEVSTEEPPYGATVWVGANRPSIAETPLPVSGLYAGKHGGGGAYAGTMIATIPGQPGFSGSALLWRGKVIGIVVHGYGRGDFHWLGHTRIQAALDLLSATK